jgi:RNA polymerase sigma factor (TIGR02999 family)
MRDRGIAAVSMNAQIGPSPEPTGRPIWRMPHGKASREHSVITDPRDVADPAAVERLVPLVYPELRRLAHRHLINEATGHTLTTTDLVHQAYLDLATKQRTVWRDRAHFMAIAAVAMRRILVDHARAHRSLKRGGALRRVPLEAVDAADGLPADARAELLLALDEALDRLRALDARQARVVECRFFAGMTEEETAQALDVSVRTARRDWTKAKAWLYGEVYARV